MAPAIRLAPISTGSMVTWATPAAASSGSASDATLRSPPPAISLAHTSGDKVGPAAPLARRLSTGPWGPADIAKKTASTPSRLAASWATASRLCPVWRALPVALLMR